MARQKSVLSESTTFSGFRTVGFCCFRSHNSRNLFHIRNLSTISSFSFSGTCVTFLYFFFCEIHDFPPLKTVPSLVHHLGKCRMQFDAGINYYTRRGRIGLVFGKSEKAHEHRSTEFYTEKPLNTVVGY